MRIAVATLHSGVGGRFNEITNALCDCLRTIPGNDQVDSIPIKERVDSRLAFYDYIIIAVESRPFRAQCPPILPLFLAAQISLSGKRSCAFVTGRGFFVNRTLKSIMKAMEVEGMRVNDFAVINSAHHARIFASGLAL